MRLLRLEAARRPLSLIVLGLLSLVASCCVLAAWALVGYLSDLGRYAITGSSEERTLTVIPAQPEERGTPIDFEKPPLTEEDHAFLRALPGVEQCRVIYGVPLPATLILKMPPIIDTYQFVAIYGMATEAVPEDLREEWAKDEGPMPLLANPQIVTLYNLGLADRYAMPRMSGEVLQQVKLTLLLGKDPYADLKNYHYAEARFAGFSPDVTTWGVAVPHHRIEALQRKLLGARARALRINQCRLVLRDNASLEQAFVAIQARGLNVDGNTQLAAAVTRAETTAERLLFGLLLGLGLIGLCSTAALSSAVVAERRAQLRRFLMAGARWWQLAVIFTSGLLGSLLIGALVGWLTAWAAVPGIARAFADILLGAETAPLATLPEPGLGFASLPLTLALAVGIGLTAVLPVLWQAERQLLHKGLRHS